MKNKTLNEFFYYVVAWVVIITVITFFVARRKTEKPLWATLIGFVCSFIPPIVMFYLVLLGLREDIDKTKESQCHDPKINHL